MKRLVFAIAILSVLMFACNFSTATSQPVPPTVVTQPPISPSETPVVPTDTPSGPQANVTCNELSFYLDPLVAFGFTCNTVPERAVGINPTPQYTQVILTTYQTGSAITPEIDVFPVQGYASIYPPKGISDFVTSLQALIDGGTPGQDLPFLNPYEAARIIYAKYKVLHVPSGGGIRYLTESAQNITVIDNNHMYYTYQGLTSDGKYVITAILPDANPILPNNNDTYPGGETYEQFDATFTSYIADTKTQLDAQPPATFAPGLLLLDDLIKSIQIQP
jgi:hypothetical protein